MMDKFESIKYLNTYMAKKYISSIKSKHKTTEKGEENTYATHMTAN